MNDYQYVAGMFLARKNVMQMEKEAIKKAKATYGKRPAPRKEEDKNEKRRETQYRTAPFNQPPPETSWLFGPPRVIIVKQLKNTEPEHVEPQDSELAELQDSKLAELQDSELAEPLAAAT